jgi:indole-3-glycerol phosphate synthase
VETARLRRPLVELERQASDKRPDAAAFAARLARQDRVNVIAECKRRSPSKGILRAEYEPAAIAQAYERAGAAAVSVLTEPTFFDGSLTDLARVTRTVSVPVLRKDFVVDEYQLVEARAAGASAVLLIVAALDDRSLARLLRAATSLGLASLVEVHEREELDRAFEAGAGIIGVNARSLRTLEVRADIVLALGSAIPDDVIAVAESGISSGADVRALRETGYDALLVGERLMTAEDPGRALRELMQEGA